MNDYTSALRKQIEPSSFIRLSVLILFLTADASWGAKYIQWKDQRARRTCALELATIRALRPTLFDYTGDPDFEEVAIILRRAFYSRLADVSAGELYPYLPLSFRYQPIVSAWTTLSQAGWEISVVGEPLFDSDPESVLQPFVFDPKNKLILFNHRHFETDPNLTFAFAVSLALSELLPEKQIDRMLESLTRDTRQHLQSLINNEFLTLDDAEDSWGGGTATLVEAPPQIHDKEPYGYRTQAAVGRSVVGYVLGELARVEFYILFRKKHSWIANANDDTVSLEIVSSPDGLQTHLEESIALQYGMQRFAAKDLLRAIVSQNIPQQFSYPALVQSGNEIRPQDIFPNPAHRLDKPVLFRY